MVRGVLAPRKLSTGVHWRGAKMKWKTGGDAVEMSESAGLVSRGGDSGMFAPENALLLMGSASVLPQGPSRLVSE